MNICAIFSLCSFLFGMTLVLYQ
uniref:NADH dehydrogenase subunit 6 n=1 Tax=Romanomermis culicivorax TaxID=13658 RepID=A0A915JWV2_ROMCU